MFHSNCCLLLNLSKFNDIKFATDLLFLLFTYCDCSVPIVLVGNKTDLYVDRMVKTDEGKRLADSWHATFLETSAKQNEV